jgi:hypothetical protein
LSLCEFPRESRAVKLATCFILFCIAKPMHVVDERLAAWLVAERPPRWAAWGAPHFLVHMKWEFVNRPLMHGTDYMVTLFLVLLLSQDELNSFGVA